MFQTFQSDEHGWCCTTYMWLIWNYSNVDYEWNCGDFLPWKIHCPRVFYYWKYYRNDDDYDNNDDVDVDDDDDKNDYDNNDNNDDDNFENFDYEYDVVGWSRRWLCADGGRVQ